LNAEPCILLTGATGFFGAFLLREFITATAYHINCLVRARDMVTARQRIAENLQHYSLWDESVESRISVSAGNLSREFLGLSAADFQGLAASVDAIYHSGALTSPLFPPERIRATNVSGTHWLIKLAAMTKPKQLIYVSSTSARRTSESAYDASKGEAEQLIRRAAADGLPVRIYRIPRLGPDSRTGQPNQKDMFISLLRLILQTGTAPDITLNEAWISVDIAAKLLIRHAERSSGGTEFEMKPPGQVSLGYMLRLAYDHGFDIEMRSLNDWVKTVRRLDSARHDLVLSALGLDGELPDPEPGPDSPGAVEDDRNKDERYFEVIAAPGVTKATLDRYLKSHSEYE
jgi:thioester reductase-like protein